MDFPLPIRSFTTTIDVTASLFVDTNIVYQLDNTKFPGLMDNLHSLEPTLIVDPNVAWRSCTEPSTQYLDNEHEDLYDLIDSLDVDEPSLFPADSLDNILDLPDIQSDLPKDFLGHADSFNTDNKFYQVGQNLDFGVNDTNQEKSRCRFTKRKRCPSTSTSEDVTHLMEFEELMCPKTRKLDSYDNAIDDYSVSGYSFPELGQTSVSYLCDSPIKRFCERQW